MAQKPYTRDQLQQAVDLVAAHGTCAAAGRLAQIPVSTLMSRWKTAQSKGYKPEVQRLIGIAAAPEGYKLKGTSTLYDEHGVARLQWVKTDADLAKLQEMQRAVLRAMCEALRPIDTISGPSSAAADLCTQYTITDAHVGMLAWGREAGTPWDLVIAEKVLTETLIRMIIAAPDSALGIINQLGDFLHFDGLKPLTPEHGNVLDADSRYQKIVEVATRILRRVIEFALTKHPAVHVFMHEGNHDPAGSVWLRVMFAQLYENNPRVTVEMSPLPYVALQWGKTMLAYHHGHLAKSVNLPLIFAERFSEMWGNTIYRYVHAGHKHEVSEKEHPGMKWIQHPTLAAPDAYAARGGWLSKRQATSMTYHKEKGEVARGIFIPE